MSTSTPPIGSTSPSQNQTTTSPQAGGALDKDAFMKLLVTQLQNQDPSSPMDDTQFISQMAQFSGLEQMQNLNATLTAAQTFQGLSEASGMIGKYVSLIDGNGNPVTGQVQEVRQIDGKPNVLIDNQEYDASTITQVSDQPITAADAKAALAANSGIGGSNANSPAPGAPGAAAGNLIL